MQINIEKIKKMLPFLYVLLALVVFLFFKSMAGAFLVLSFIAIIIVSQISKNPDIKIISLVLLTLVSIMSIMFNGIVFGIDFSGGTRIPVILEQSVSEQTMNEMVKTIKTRAASFGLTEVKVQSVGSSQIFVEVPSSDEKLIQKIESVLSHQGVFEGVVDGHIAIKGDYIQPGTISYINPSYLVRSGADWGVSFSVNQEGAEYFAKVVKGKANKPLHLFLDRLGPNDIVVLSKKDFLPDENADLNKTMEIIRKACVINGSKMFGIYFSEDVLNESIKSVEENKTAKAIVSEKESEEIKDMLKNKGYIVVEKSEKEIKPKYSKDAFGNYDPNSVYLIEWKAIGLISSPILSPGVTEGNLMYNYQITGQAEGVGAEKTHNAQAEAKEIVSVLKGGSLPVKISLGSKTTIPAPLGEEFLKMSIVGTMFALVMIGVFVMIKYRTPVIFLPMILISLAEIIILVSIIGSFTIDLSAMAGIIGAIGVSIDSKIIIADELLKKTNVDINKKLERAFSIIIINVITSMVAMLPLLFSGMVEVIGFATSSIFGSILGGFISRPAFGAALQRIMRGKKKNE